MVDGATHTKYPASSSHRWINCSLTISKGNSLPDPPSTIFALEGTAAHSLGEYCLKNKKSPTKFIGKKIKVKDSGKVHKIEVTKELAESVAVYVKYCLKLLKDAEKNKKPFVHGIEKKFFVKDTHDEVGGTIDFFIFTDGVLHIIDYKHGEGVDVDSEGNKQLMIYALAVLDSSQYIRRLVKEIKITIVQPRSHGSDDVKVWTTDKKQLETYRKNIMAALIRHKNHPKQANSGPWCKWCKVESTCPRLYKDAEKLAANDFDDDVDEIYIASIIENKNKILSYIKACEDYAWKKMIGQGEKINGLKIVKGRGKRILKEGGLILNSLARMGYNIKEVSEPAKILPLTKLEKIVKKEDLEDLIDYQEGKEIIVPASDKRPEYDSAQEDF